MIALQLFISLIILLASLCYYGFKLKSFINSETPQKFEIEDIIYGIIFFYVLSIIINFFTPIYFEISFFIIFLGLFLLLLEIKKIKMNVNFFFVTTLILATLITIYMHKPLLYDSKLYHLQGIEWIQNNRVVFGLTNINYRLGQVPLNWSVLPLLRVFNFENNYYLFNIIIFFLLFYFSYQSFKKKNKENSDYFIISFFLLIFLKQLKYFDLWGIFNAISSPETDVSSGIFLTLGTYFFIKNFENRTNINLAVITSLFLFIAIAIKVTSFTAILIQALFFYYLFKENRKIFQKIIILIFSLYFFLMIKNFINSGCLFFPLNFTCFEPFWGIEINSPNDKYSLKNFLDDVMIYSQNTFSYKHIILKYFFILSIIFLACFILSINKNIYNVKRLNINIKIIIFFYILSIFIFFYYVKNFRFNWYLFYNLIALLFMIILINYKPLLNKYINTYVFTIIVIIILFQNLSFIYFQKKIEAYDYKSDYKIKNLSNFSYKLGSMEGFCYNFLPPCSNYEINENTEYKSFFYKFYFKKNLN